MWLYLGLAALAGFALSRLTTDEASTPTADPKKDPEPSDEPMEPVTVVATTPDAPDEEVMFPVPEVGLTPPEEADPTYKANIKGFPYPPLVDGWRVIKGTDGRIQTDAVLKPGQFVDIWIQHGVRDVVKDMTERARIRTKVIGPSDDRPGAYNLEQVSSGTPIEQKSLTKSIPVYGTVYRDVYPMFIRNYVLDL